MPQVDEDHIDWGETRGPGDAVEILHQVRDALDQEDDPATIRRFIEHYLEEIGEW